MDAPEIPGTSQELSQYVAHLDNNVRSRYLEKCQLLGVADPYNLPTSLFKDVYGCPAAELPDLAYHDLYNYLVNQQSYFTGKALKAYKSLEAYKYFVAGWVWSVQRWKVPHKNLYLIMSKVGLLFYDSNLPSPAILFRPYSSMLMDNKDVLKTTESTLYRF